MTGGVNIVIVEEPCLSRNVLIKALHSWGYGCLVAEKEAQAWTALSKAQGPALVLVDWLADFLDCEEFFDGVRNHPEFKDFYLMGGIPRGAVGAIRRCMSCGANDFLYQPYDLDEVRVRLHIASRVMGLEPCALTFVGS